MDVKEKLVELLVEFVEVDAWDNGEFIEKEIDFGKIAENLISSGVTVQEWISVKDKLPPYNCDVLVYRPNMAMKILVDTYDGYYGDDDDEWYEGWALYGEDTHGNPVITHWAYLPQPPKGE